MRKLESKEQIEQKKKQNQILIGVVMIIILVFSTAGFALLNHDSTDTSGSSLHGYNGRTVDSNGREFVNSGGYWVTDINGRANAFFNLPENVTDVNINITSTIGSFSNQPLYFTDTNSVRDHIAFNLYPEYILRVNAACVDGVDCVNSTFPQKSCENDNIIVFLEKADSSTKVYQEENCIYIEGDLAKGADKLLYKIFLIE